ncbi:MAG: dTDP-glucose 4,6-dehydratase [Methanomicrobiales archaeon]|nr:dTDP-glucose 4,6-dehydratase [Methanomicrobiales archaeon]
MNILVTGGCGFIGSNFIRHVLSEENGYSIINLDKITYAGNIANLQDLVGDPRYTFIRGDICDKRLVDLVFHKHSIETVVHFAAESHVDRSITDSSPFVMTNVLGTQVLLDAALHHGITQFIHISTDEVYGSTASGSFTEFDNLHPSSPYSASKAASDLLVHAYYTTHDLPALITRCTNNFGPYQYPEKLIPLFITNLLEGRNVPVYGTGKNVRDWIYVLDHCRAIEFLMDRGKPGEIYNIGGRNEKTNLEITYLILELLGKDKSMIEYVKDRPGHDFRYSLDCSKIRGAGWQPEYKFEDAMVQTIEWYRRNEWWWKPLKK